MNKLHFDSYSEFSLYFDKHDDLFELVIDYFDNDKYGWGVFYYIPTGQYFYEEIDENDAVVVEIKPIARLVYDANHDIVNKDGDILSSLFNCDICGESVKEDRIEYIWFEKT